MITEYEDIYKAQDDINGENYDNENNESEPPPKRLKVCSAAGKP